KVAVVTEAACIRALKRAAERLGSSPTKAEYEALKLQPASGTIMREMGGWNAAKEAAGLTTYRQGEGGGTEIRPKPDWVDLPPGECWEELNGQQRWYRKNRKASRRRKDRRRKELAFWLYEYKRDNCECERCGETRPGCLEFHHLDAEEKQFRVSEMAYRGHSIQSILAEMDRCIVLCANCHRMEHWEPPEPPAGSQN
ncbi:MAG: hypothetical protein R3324_12245, partial [Halobacteriales archaeon]|nr:hypothetical protein [Halobacteriales archaeon]